MSRTKPLRFTKLVDNSFVCHPGQTAEHRRRAAEEVATELVDDCAVLVREAESNMLAISHGKPMPARELPLTLPLALQRTALRSQALGIVYLQSDGSELVQSYEALIEEAERILAGLRQLGLKPQDRVIFQLENRDFIPAFWGCMLGGFVPVPLPFAPTYKSANSAVNKLHNAWQMLERPLILTSKELTPAVRSLSNLLSLKNFQVAAIDDLRSPAPDRHWHTSQPDDLAVLILTSGSTGRPKGVMLSHRNIASNVAASAQMNGFSSEDVSLNWLNLDHVGSLIRCSIRDIYVGSQQIHAPAAVVLENPLRWLDWLDRYRVTFAWAPNFALALVNDRAEAIGQRRWDLSSVRSLVSVAEAIVPRTAKRFLELLAPHGLSAAAMHAAWGMSETCAAVTFSHSYLSLPSPDYPFVEVGAPIPGFNMRIVDSRGQIVPEGTVGQLQISGPMITCGYYQNPELNREAFTEDGWLKTGDLGFLRAGRLTVTGRQKDVIIINGLNYYSHEIEAVVEAVAGVEASYTAACAVRPEGNTDRLAIFFHTSLADRDRLALLKEIRGNVVRQIGVNPAYLIPVAKEVIPKTAIGKIQRGQLKTRFEAGEFEAIEQLDILRGNANTLANYVLPRTELERQLTILWQQVLNVPQVGIHDNFFELGGSSVLAVQLFARIEQVCGKNLPLATLFQAATVEQLANVFQQERSTPYSSLVTIQPGGTKPPLFGIHEVFGNILFYRDLARHLGPEQPFYALQARGMDGTQPPLTQLKDMAALYIKEIRTLQPDGPYFLVGFSLGGLLAFEMAQQLHASGQRIALLALIDSHGEYDFEQLPLRERLFRHLSNLLRLGPTYMIHKLERRVKERKENRDRPTSDLLPNDPPHVAVRKANRQASRDYVFQTYPGRITFFQASDSSVFEGWVPNAHLCWSQRAAGGLEVYEIPGNHFSTVQEPHVQVLAKKLRACLDRA